MGKEKSEMKGQFLQAYNQLVQRPGADKLLMWLQSTDFFTAPASTRFHLAREGGLVEHSVHVYTRLRELYVREFPKVEVPEASLAICGLLHDVCKANVYKPCAKNQKNYDAAKVAAAESWQVKHDALGDFIWESVMGYQFEDSLPYGHGEKSVYIISGFMRLTREEAMAIRWHMGFSDNDFKGGGYSVGNAFEKFPLAVLTHIADLQATYLDERSGAADGVKRAAAG